MWWGVKSCLCNWAVLGGLGWGRCYWQEETPGRVISSLPSEPGQAAPVILGWEETRTSVQAQESKPHFPDAPHTHTHTRVGSSSLALAPQSTLKMECLK